MSGQTTLVLLAGLLSILGTIIGIWVTHVFQKRQEKARQVEQERMERRRELTRGVAEFAAEMERQRIETALPEIRMYREARMPWASLVLLLVGCLCSILLFRAEGIDALITTIVIAVAFVTLWSIVNWIRNRLS